jgi:hypothetical protein
MGVEYKVHIFRATELATSPFDSESWKERNDRVTQILNKMAAEGWRVVGQSVFAEVQTDESTMVYSTDEAVKTTFRLLYTLMRET